MAGMKSMARRVRLLLDEGGLQNCLLAMQLLLARRARHMGLLLAERFCMKWVTVSKKCQTEGVNTVVKSQA
jgi:hypothetical protein